MLESETDNTHTEKHIKQPDGDSWFCYLKKYIANDHSLATDYLREKKKGQLGEWVVPNKITDDPQESESMRT